MMKILTGLLLLTLACLANAHHSPAGYAQDVEMVLEGKIAEYEWANPHVYIHLDVPSANGTDRWQVEANPPTILRRQGWTATSFARGEVISVTVSPAVNRSRHLGFAHTVTKADGTRLVNFDPDRFFGPAEESEPEPDPETASTTDTLTGIWLSEPGPELSAVFGVIGPPKAELTAAGHIALEAFDEDTMHPGVDCTQFPPPIYMVIPAVISIELGDETSIIRSDFEGVERIIHMNVDTHEGASASLHGHSVGRWDGATLVVDTARFSPHVIGTVFRVPSGPDKHLVERFELDPEGTSLTYSFELEDPDYLAAPITGRMKWRYRPDLEYSPVACDPENARRFTGQ